jgi:chaperonin GroES
VWWWNRSNKKISPLAVLFSPKRPKKKPQKGVVLSVGPGDRDEQGKRIPMGVAKDDTVLFAKYSGTEIKIDGKKLLILRETDLLAIVEK